MYSKEPETEYYYEMAKRRLILLIIIGTGCLISGVTVALNILSNSEDQIAGFVYYFIIFGFFVILLFSLLDILSWKKYSKKYPNNFFSLRLQGSLLLKLKKKSS